MPDNYMEFRVLIDKAMQKSAQVIKDVDKEFESIFGRGTDGFIEEYHVDDADAVLLIAGTVASTAKYVVDAMRKEGKKVGLEDVVCERHRNPKRKVAQRRAQRREDR